MKISFFLYVCFFTTMISQNEILIIFNGNNTKMTKFEVLFVQSLIKDYEKRVQKKVKIRFKGIKNFGSMFKLIDQGERDYTLAINTISITEDRLKKYDFSEAYIQNSYAFLGKRYVSGKMNNQRISYVRNTIYEQLAFEFKDKVKSIKAYNKMQDCIKDLSLGKVDLVLTDYTDGWIYNLNFVKSYKTQIKDRFGIIYPKGSKLKEQIDISFKSVYKSAEFYNLVKKSFGKKAVPYFSNN